MKRKLLITSMVFILGLPFVANAASSGVSFGGRVLFEYTCNTGLLVYIKSATPPYLTLPVMWFWGELPFLSHIPPHPGQQLLGVMSPTPIPCFLGYFPIGYGFPIEYHGSSI